MSDRIKGCVVTFEKDLRRYDDWITVLGDVMTTLKGGDKVRRRLETHSWAGPADTVLTVRRVSDDGKWLEFHETDARGLAQFFVLVEPAPETITLTPEAIRAAATSPDVEAALRKLAPEAFPPTPPGRLSTERVDGNGLYTATMNTPFGLIMGKRVTGSLKNRGFWLDRQSGRWAIEIDDEGELVLTCTQTGTPR